MSDDRPAKPKQDRKRGEAAPAKPARAAAAAPAKPEPAGQEAPARQEAPASRASAVAAAAGDGGRQLLFYEHAVPVTSDRHGAWSVELGRDYAFARSTNSVPLTRVEFARTAREYPIVFAGPDEQPFPLAILGLADRQNLFIRDDGSWGADYLPAFVRRYPFVFTTTDNAQTFTLCIDEAFSGCNDEARGERLFDDAGTPTRYLDNVMAFLREYQAEHQRTQAFGKRMAVLGLLEPMQANVALPSGQRMSLTDFKVVNRDKLKQIRDAALREMFTADDLEMVYLHLQSLQNFSSLVNRLSTAV